LLSWLSFKLPRPLDSSYTWTCQWHR